MSILAAFWTQSMLFGYLTLVALVIFVVPSGRFPFPLWNAIPLPRFVGDVYVCFDDFLQAHECLLPALFIILGLHEFMTAMINFPLHTLFLHRHFTANLFNVAARAGASIEGWA